MWWPFEKKAPTPFEYMGMYRNATREEVAQEEREKYRDLFALHAHIDDVLLAEADMIEAYGAAGILDTDPLTIRIKARYTVADKMLQVRGEQ